MGGAYLLGLAAAALSGGITGAAIGFAASAGTPVCVPPYVAVAALIAASGSAGVAAVSRLARR